MEIFLLSIFQINVGDFLLFYRKLKW